MMLVYAATPVCTQYYLGCQVLLHMPAAIHISKCKVANKLDLTRWWGWSPSCVRTACSWLGADACLPACLTNWLTDHHYLILIFNYSNSQKHFFGRSSHFFRVVVAACMGSFFCAGGVFCDVFDAKAFRIPFLLSASLWLHTDKLCGADTASALILDTI